MLYEFLLYSKVKQPYSITFYSASQVVVCVCVVGGGIFAIQVVITEVFTFLKSAGIFSEIRELDQIFFLTVLPGTTA